MTAAIKEERIARALSAASRRAILRFLSEKERTVSEIASQAGLSLSLASKHLMLLCDLGFLSVRKNPPQKYYSVRIKQLPSLLSQYDAIDKHLPPHFASGEERLSRVVKADARRQILRLLSEREMTVSEVAQAAKMSKSLASRHLKMAHDLGFLNIRKDAPHKYYSLAVKPLKGILEHYNLVIRQL